MSEKLKVRHLVVYLAKQGGEIEGAVSVSQVNAMLSGLIDEGYHIVNTHYVGENPAGYGMIYVLAL